MGEVTGDWIVVRYPSWGGFENRGPREVWTGSAWSLEVAQAARYGDFDAAMEEAIQTPPTLREHLSVQPAPDLC